MEKFIFTYDDIIGLSYKISTGPQIETFGCFLRECGSDLSRSFFKEWALDANQEVTGGNINQLIKYKNNIYISEFDDDYEFDEEGNTLPTGVEHEFKISIEEFIKTLDEWEKVVAFDPLPKEIIIKQDDEEKISFETVF